MKALFLAFLSLLVSSTSLAQVSPARAYAAFIYQRVGGVTLPIDAPILVTMEGQINNGDIIGAVNTVISSEPNFYNITVRELAAKMSTDDEVANAPTTDMVADIVGLVRDGMDARSLVNGNFWYQADPAKAVGVPVNMVSDLLTSNNHYAFLDSKGIDLGSTLINVGSQLYLNTAGTAGVANPDPAGVLTSRGFMMSNANAGTNRRLVKYAFREFECYDIADYSGPGPDAMVGKDVDRYPGGDNNVYQNKCKLCHNRLDGMRPAFAMFDLDVNSTFVEHALFNPKPCTAKNVDYSGTGHNTCAGQFDPNNIAIKELRNAQVFAGGYQVTSPAWINNATGGTYDAMFSWSGSVQGSGANQFGQMIANSGQFPRCMAQKIFESVCKRDPTPDEAALVAALGINFSGAWKYQMKTLYAQVAALPGCLALAQ